MIVLNIPCACGNCSAQISLRDEYLLVTSSDSPVESRPVLLPEWLEDAIIKAVKEHSNE